jgi:hypothetical protein
MNEVEIDIEEALTRLRIGVNDMGVPDLVVERLCGHFGLLLSRRTIALARS